MGFRWAVRRGGCSGLRVLGRGGVVWFRVIEGYLEVWIEWVDIEIQNILCPCDFQLGLVTAQKGGTFCRKCDCITIQQVMSETIVQTLCIRKGSCTSILQNDGCGCFEWL
jgi:hypothetical protein